MFKNLILNYLQKKVRFEVGKNSKCLFYIKKAEHLCFKCVNFV